MTFLLDMTPGEWIGVIIAVLIAFEAFLAWLRGMEIDIPISISRLMGQTPPATPGGSYAVPAAPVMGQPRATPAYSPAEAGWISSGRGKQKGVFVRKFPCTNRDGAQGETIELLYRLPFWLRLSRRTVWLGREGFNLYNEPTRINPNAVDGSYELTIGEQWYNRKQQLTLADFQNVRTWADVISLWGKHDRPLRHGDRVQLFYALPQSPGGITPPEKGAGRIPQDQPVEMTKPLEGQPSEARTAPTLAPTQKNEKAPPPPPNQEGITIRSPFPYKDGEAIQVIYRKPPLSLQDGITLGSTAFDPSMIADAAVDGSFELTINAQYNGTRPLRKSDFANDRNWADVVAHWGLSDMTLRDGNWAMLYYALPKPSSPVTLAKEEGIRFPYVEEAGKPADAPTPEGGVPPPPEPGTPAATLIPGRPLEIKKVEPTPAQKEVPPPSEVFALIERRAQIKRRMEKEEEEIKRIDAEYEARQRARQQQNQAS